jgi:CheY-like chemotaxis protein
MKTERRRVLVVEHDMEVSGRLVRILGRLDYEVLVARDVGGALDLAGEADIIFLDPELPGLPGERFLDRIRSRGNYAPVVVMQASAPRPETMEALEAHGVVDFLRHPITAGAVADKAARAAAVADGIRELDDVSERLKGFIERQSRAKK